MPDTDQPDAEQRYTPAEIAEIAHEANRALQRVHLAHHPDAPVPVAPPWAEFDEASAAGVVEGVIGVLAGDDPEDSHERWVAGKLADGWTWGEVKNADAKTHPCLVPYDDLPADQRDKDELFGAIVTALGAVVDDDPDLSGRHPGVQDVARYLLKVNPKLDSPQAGIAALFRATAVMILTHVDDTPQLVRGLDDLLRSEDAIVRASLPRPDEEG